MDKLNNFVPPKEQKCRDIKSEAEKPCNKCFWCRFNGKEYVCEIDMYSPQYQKELRELYGLD